MFSFLPGFKVADKKQPSKQPYKKPELDLKQFLKEDLMLIRSDPTKQIQDGVETDISFAEDMTAIMEVKMALAKDSENAKDKAFEYTDEFYDEIDKKAILHSKANQLHKNSMKKFKEIECADRCHCGCKRGLGEEYDFFEDEQKLNFLGPGVILFFFYIKCMVMVLGIVALSYGIYPLVLNLIGDNYTYKESDCSGSSALTHWLCEYKPSASIQNRNTNHTTMSIQLFIGVLLCVFWIVCLRMIRYYGRLKNKMVDILLDSSSDYTIQISDLPYGKYHQGEIIEFINDLYESSETKKNLQQEPLKIKSVQVIYNMRRFRVSMSELNRLIHEIWDYLEVVDSGADMEGGEIDIGGNDNLVVDENSTTKYMIKKQNDRGMAPEEILSAYKETKAEIIRIYQELKDFRRQFISEEQFRMKKATSTCLVEFVNSEQQTMFLNQFGRFRYSVIRELKEKIMNYFFPNPSSIIFKGQYLSLTRAPQPSDIDWVNCEKKFDYWRIGLVWCITFGIIGVSLGMLMFISFLRKNIPILKDLSILISISLQLFNRLIWKTLVRFVGLEENNTKTDATISIMSKASFAQAVNSLTLPIFMNVLYKDNFSGPSGLVGLCLDFQFTIFLMAIAMNLVDPPYLLKKIILNVKVLRNWMIFHLSKIVGKQYDNQEVREIYKYYEQPQLPIAGAYVYILTAINQSMFYSFLQPSLLFVITGNVFFFYLIQKYLLIKRCKIPPLTDLIVFETCVSLSMRIPLFLGVGTLIFVVRQDDIIWVHILAASLMIVVSMMGNYNPKKIFTKLMWVFVPDEDEPEYMQREKRQKEEKEKEEGRKQKKNSVTKDSILEIEPTPIGDVSATGLMQTMGMESNLSGIEANTSEIKVNSNNNSSQGKAVQNSSNNQIRSVTSSQKNTHAANKDPQEFYKVMMENELKDFEVSQRRQCYYKNSNLNHLLNFEREFMEIEGVNFNLSKKFCENFSENYVHPQKLNKTTAMMMIKTGQKFRSDEQAGIEDKKKQNLRNAKLRKAKRMKF